MKKIFSLVLALILLISSLAYATDDAVIVGKEFSIKRTDCSPFIVDGQACYDTDDDILYVGNGTTAVAASGGTGDVTSAGDCTSGACLDGTSDGGTYIKFYDAQGDGQLVTGNLTAARVWTTPDSTGTIALTNGNVATATALAANGADCSAGQAPLGVDASGVVESCWTPVSGPASSTDNTIPRYDGTTGKLLQGSSVTIDDSNNMTIPATLSSIHVFTDASWNDDDVTWTMTGTGPLVHVTGNTTTVTATNTEAIVAGTTYKVTITGTGGTATATYTLGDITGTTIAATGAIAITDYITAATTASMIITPASACTVSITSITIEKLTDATGDLTVEGNLIVQSPATFSGQTLISDGSASAPSLAWKKYPTTGFFATASNIIRLALIGSEKILLGDGYIQILGTNAAFYLSSDVVLTRIAANSLAMRNGVSAQTFSLYETYTDASNYESYSLDAGVTTADTFTIKGNADGAGSGSNNLGFNFTTAGTGVMAHTMADHAATPVAPTRTTKTFVHTASLAADGDDACGTTADCLTLPIPTTMGYLEMWTNGSLYLSAVCVNAGTCTVITDSDAAGVGVEYNAAIAACTGLCLHDGGTNSIIFNDTAGAVTITVKMTYD